MLNTRQIFNFFPTYTTINEKLQAKEFAEEIFYFQDDD